MQSLPDANAAAVSRASLEAALTAQEHRLFHVLYNFYQTRKLPRDDERRDAANRALLWRIVSPTTVAVASGGILAVITAVVSVLSLRSLTQQNEMLAAQNALISQQNQLAEAERRSSLIFELTAILDRVGEEVAEHRRLRPEPDESSSSIPPSFAHAPQRHVKYSLSPALVGRIGALSRSLKPYRQLHESGELEAVSLSPERAQLLLSLYASRVQIPSRFQTTADFSFSDLRGTRLEGAMLSGLAMSHASFGPRRSASGQIVERSSLRYSLIVGEFDYCSFEEANLHSIYIATTGMYRANFRRADLSSSEIHASDFDVADFGEANLERTKMDRISLRNANFANATLRHVNFDGVSLNDANLTRADLTDAVIKNTPMRRGQLTEARLDRAVFENVDLRGADLAAINGWQSMQSIKGSNIHNIVNAPTGFVQWALDNGAIVDANAPASGEERLDPPPPGTVTIQLPD
jgi:uncharacterized protein YjbI with pentapeptide repeats